MMCTCCEHKNELGIKTGYTSNQADCDICGAIRQLNKYGIITVKTARIDEIINKIQPVNCNVLLSDIYKAIELLEKLKVN